jgi:hypothetical protein
MPRLYATALVMQAIRESRCFSEELAQIKVLIEEMDMGAAGSVLPNSCTPDYAFTNYIKLTNYGKSTEFYSSVASGIGWTLSMPIWQTLLVLRT